MAENLSLFQKYSPPKKREDAPLAEMLRPSDWEKFRGLEALDKNLLAQLKEGKRRPPSLVLWGPPGCGKTTLAKLVGKSYDVEFVEISAVLAGVKDVREIVDEAKRRAKPTILFVDEIHRFSKSQQDAFLPHVEQGVVSLIGATTENPSFSLTGALLSRCRVVIMGSLSNAALQEIVSLAGTELEMKIGDEATRVLIEVAGGDARKLLNLIESLHAAGLGRKPLTQNEVEDYLKEAKTLFYDRSGEEHYNMVSAFIKSMRGSDADAALYWGLRMIESGEDPRFVIRRMMIFASEDIGNADPRALQLAVATHDAYERLGLPEGKIPISHCITYLATAPKSNRSYNAMHAAIEAIKQHPKIGVPIHLRNAPTKVMKSIGYGADYEYPHAHEGAFVAGVSYLPDELKGEKFYDPSDRGYEKTIKERLKLLGKKP